MRNKELIEATLDDLITSFLYYDRKEDEELPLYAIENSIKNGEITIKDIFNMLWLEILDREQIRTFGMNPNKYLFWSFWINKGKPQCGDHNYFPQFCNQKFI